MRKSLSSRMTLFATLGIIGLLGVIIVFVNYVRIDLNNQAYMLANDQIDQRMKILQSQIRFVAQDYNNWDDAYYALKRNDIQFLADNYGISAINGDLFDGAIIFGGPLDSPISWKKNQSRRPAESFLTDSVLAEIRGHINELNTDEKQTFDFARLKGDKLALVSASELRPDKNGFRSNNLNDAAVTSEYNLPPIGLIERQLSEVDFDQIKTDLSLKILDLSDKKSSLALNTPILGMDGVAIAYLIWLPPTPGTKMIRRIGPLLGAITLLLLAASAAGVFLLQRNAHFLMDRERDANRLARQDHLTALPNRMALMEHLSEVNSFANSPIALVVFDLNAFKRINDLVGHEGGDSIVCDLAARLKNDCPDHFTIYRIGGDEFVIVLVGQFNLFNRMHDAVAFVEESLSRPFHYEGTSFLVSAAFGIAIQDEGSVLGDELLRRADRAMYVSKRNGADCACLYDEEMHLKRLAEKSVERALRDALKSGSEIFVFYQPIVDARSGKIVKVEALARWNSATAGNVSPAVFIPIAEESGIIDQLGDVVFNIVCRDLASLPQLRSSINVSPLQLLSSGFASKILRIAEMHGISPSRIELEVTEGVAVQNLASVINTLANLQASGFSITLDDFGTGFSSIGYLRQMPFSGIKIDKSLIPGRDSLMPHEGIMSSIVSLGHSLDKQVTAEGIETEADLRHARAAGVDLIQGFYFGSPQSFSSIRSTVNAKDAARVA